MKKQKILGFTIVELIIVITILSILATIAFISFGGFNKDARDSSRLATIAQAKKSLEVHYTNTSNYPLPDEIYGTGTYTQGGITTDTNYVGYIGENLSRKLNFNQNISDPLTKNKYVIGVSANEQKYQIAFTLEKLQVNNPIISTTYAGENQKAKVIGNYKYPLKMGKRIYTLPSLIFIKNDIGDSEKSTNFIIDEGENIPYSLNPTNTTPTNTETLTKQLEKITGKPNLSFTGIDISTYTSVPDFKLADITTLKEKTGIDDKNTLGNVIFGNKEYPIIASANNEGQVKEKNTPAGEEVPPKEEVPPQEEIPYTPENCFEFNSLTKTVTKYTVSNNGCGLDVIIPLTFGGVAVENIGDGAFSSLNYWGWRPVLNSVIIPSGVKTIGNSAFQNAGFTGITIPNTVTSIGDYAFSQCGLKNIVLPPNIVSIGDYAFGQNTITSLNIPSSIESIGENAFYGNSISSLTLPNKNITLGNGVFSSNSLTGVEIPPNLKTIPEMMFHNNLLVNVIIPEGITSIGPYSFSTPWSGVKTLETLKLPSTLTSIGDGAFTFADGYWGSSGNNMSDFSPNFTGDYIIDGNKWKKVGPAVTYTPEVCFTFIPSNNEITGYNSTNPSCPKDVIVPPTIGGVVVKNIGGMKDNGINSLVLPEGIINIYQYAFWNNNLSKAEIPSTVNKVFGSAFNANILDSVIILGDSTVVEISSFCFNVYGNRDWNYYLGCGPSGVIWPKGDYIKSGWNWVKQ